MKKKGLISTCIILAVAIFMAVYTGISFNKKRNFVEDVVTEGSAVTRTEKLSTYNKYLANTFGDVDIYVDGVKNHLTVGQMIHIEPGEVHHVVNNYDKPVKMVSTLAPYQEQDKVVVK